MIGQFLIGVVDLRLVVARFDHAGLGIVGDPEPGDTAIELRHVDMGFDPGAQFLVGESFGEGIVAGPQHTDEEVGGLLMAGFRIRPAQCFPGPVQEGLLPGEVPLPEGDLQGRLPALVMLAKLGVAIAVGICTEIFLPQQLQGHVPAAQLPVDVGQIRQWAGRRKG